MPFPVFRSLGKIASVSSTFPLNFGLNLAVQTKMEYHGSKGGRHENILGATIFFAYIATALLLTGFLTWDLVIAYRRREKKGKENASQLKVGHEGRIQEYSEFGANSKVKRRVPRWRLRASRCSLSICSGSWYRRINGGGT